jgi:malonyl-CoA decarboxylase
LRDAPEEVEQALTRLCASYLGFHSPQAGGDPVARFHLDNGARLERLNTLSDLSPKGVKQSFGLMVNYLYDLQKVEAHHEKFSHGEVAYSRALAAWL